MMQTNLLTDSKHLEMSSELESHLLVKLQTYRKQNNMKTTVYHSYRIKQVHQSLCHLWLSPILLLPLFTHLTGLHKNAEILLSMSTFCTVMLSLWMSQTPSAAVFLFFCGAEATADSITNVLSHRISKTKLFGLQSEREEIVSLL